MNFEFSLPLLSSYQQWFLCTRVLLLVRYYLSAKGIGELRILKGKMRHSALYFHQACFDGIVSATLARVTLENEGWAFTKFIPVGYEVRRKWPKQALSSPAAVVDFLYHKQADFWADHHPTAFLTPSLRRHFLARRERQCLFYDDRAGSCAGLLWRALLGRIPCPDRYRDAVQWAEKIDTAHYASVDEAIWGSSPALKIRQSLMMNADLDYHVYLLTQMESGDLQHIAQRPPVRDRYQEMNRRISAGLERVKSEASLDGDVAVIETHSSDRDIVSRYAPYYYFPKARYSVAALRSDSGIRITAMRNPWMDFKSIPIGKLLEKFGGGGHERVGSVLIPHDSAKAHQIVNVLTREMQSHPPTERDSR